MPFLTIPSTQLLNQFVSSHFKRDEKPSKYKCCKPVTHPDIETIATHVNKFLKTHRLSSSFTHFFECSLLSTSFRILYITSALQKIVTAKNINKKALYIEGSIFVEELEIVAP